MTNYHVIEQGHWTVRLNQKSGGFEHVDTDDRQWLTLPDKDLAVSPVALSQDIHKFSFLTKEWILGRELIKLDRLTPASLGALHKPE